MKTKRRLFSCLLILLIVFVLFASFYFILHESHHDCEGETCPVCAMIAICRNTLKTFSIALLLTAAFHSSLHAFLSDSANSRRIGRNDTPVSLKVRMLN
ncbi:MAG: hypothetical protein J5958_08050 [Clostridia bacterium]|nr:hypothetical protein [Clostridia bacterium]